MYSGSSARELAKRAEQPVGVALEVRAEITPTSTAVADMALCMVANGLSRDDVLGPARDLAFPKSVVAMFRGEVGAPPEASRPPAIHGRAAAYLPAADLAGGVASSRPPCGAR